MYALNKLSSLDQDFTPVFCNGKTMWTSPDPRLQNSIRNGMRLVLDALPLNGKIDPNCVYNGFDGNNYKGFYNNYSDINNGQIRYYIDSQQAVPFIPQLFNTPSTIAVDNYIDPMGTVKPHYCQENKQSHKLSWLRDSQNHRQDLLTRQMWKRNQSDWQVNNIR